MEDPLYQVLDKRQGPVPPMRRQGIICGQSRVTSAARVPFILTQRKDDGSPYRAKAGGRNRVSQG